MPLDFPVVFLPESVQESQGLFLEKKNIVSVEHVVNIRLNNTS